MSFNRNNSVRHVIFCPALGVDVLLVLFSLGVKTCDVVIVPHRSEQEPSPPLPGQASVYLGYYDAGDNIYQKIAPGETQARIERSGLTEEAVTSVRACCRVNISHHFAIFCNTPGQGMFWNIYL